MKTGFRPPRLVQTIAMLTVTVAVIGGIGTAVITANVESRLLRRMEQDAAFAVDVVGGAMDAGLERGEDGGDILAALQDSLRSTPPGSPQFLCVIDRGGTVICHPDQGIVDAGMSVAGMPTFDLDNRPSGTYGDVVAAGQEGIRLLAASPGEPPSELIYTRPVGDARWTLAVHQSLNLVDREVRGLRRVILAYAVLVGVLVVSVGTMGVRFLNRRYERHIEGINARLEGTVVRRTAELRTALHELQAAHDRLVLGEKMNLLGELMAGIAHEINNPLMVIAAHADMLQEVGEANSEETRRCAAGIQRGVERCARVVNTMLDFAREDQGERVSISLADIIGRAQTLIGADLRTRSIELRVDLPNNLPHVRVNRQQIEQVFINLIHNAAQALQDRPKPRRITIVGEDIGAFVRVAVTDNGSGISDELRERVFDTFFTTKPEGIGTGLGLSICKRFIEAHGGDIRVIEVAEGACFEIRLPTSVSVTGADLAPA